MGNLCPSATIAELPVLGDAKFEASCTASLPTQSDVVKHQLTAVLDVIYPSGRGCVTASRLWPRSSSSAVNILVFTAQIQIQRTNARDLWRIIAVLQRPLHDDACSVVLILREVGICEGQGVPEVQRMQLSMPASRVSHGRVNCRCGASIKSTAPAVVGLR